MYYLILLCMKNLKPIFDELLDLQQNLKEVISKPQNYAYEDIRSSANAILALYNRMVELFKNEKKKVKLFWAMINHGIIKDEQIKTRTLIINLICDRLGVEGNKH